MEEKERRFALLIDCDNISAKYVPCIMDELIKHGIITYRRGYGNWTTPQMAHWKEKLFEYSIAPIQQFSNTVGKNATDSALIIDAMDILYTNNVDGFCIVSSDSDFTRLASRLRESGMFVIGMGEGKTHNSFRKACTVFTNLELLIDQVEEETVSEPDELVPAKEEPAKSRGFLKGILFKRESRKASEPLSKAIIERDIINIITENENNGKATGLGEIGSRLQNRYPDFDVRNYGYSLLSKFLEELSGIVLTKKGKTITVSLIDSKSKRNAWDEYAVRTVKGCMPDGLDLSLLGQEMHDEFSEFNVKDYGYSTFRRYVQSIKELEIREDENKKKIVYIRKG